MTIFVLALHIFLSAALVSGRTFFVLHAQTLENRTRACWHIWKRDISLHGAYGIEQHRRLFYSSKREKGDSIALIEREKDQSHTHWAACTAFRPINILEESKDQPVASAERQQTTVRDRRRRIEAETTIDIDFLFLYLLGLFHFPSLGPSHLPSFVQLPKSRAHAKLLSRRPKSNDAMPKSAKIISQWALSNR